MERKCKSCPAFYEVKEKDIISTGCGWEDKVIDGKTVILCRPAKTTRKRKPMDQYCFYCLATVSAKKIANKASWTGRTPKWCPLGREVTDGK